MITNIAYKIERGRIYATITRDSIAEGEQIEIAVAGNRYKKYLPNVGEQVRIDLTPYCNSSLREVGEALNSLSANGKIYGIAQGIAVIPDIDLQRGYALFYKNATGNTDVVLTKLPYLQMSEGCSLYVAMKVADDYNEQLSCGNVTINIVGLGDVEDICIVRIQPSADADKLTISDNTGYGGANLPIRTVPSGMNTRRLVWLNEVGGIDSWSFEFLRESNFATTSEVFYSSTKGYTRTNRQSERLHTVETRELDDITASVVAYVIASPEVYLEENGVLVPIDIETEECRTYSDTELSGVQVSYRKRKREL
jgi:hypothetical protein